MNMIESFLEMLSRSKAVAVDDGALLSSWGFAQPVGDPSGQIAWFGWTDGELDYSTAITEEGAQNGRFDADGTFVCNDYEGNETKIRGFRLVPVTSPVDALASLFDAVSALRDSESSEGCETGLTVVGSVEFCNVLAAVRQLKALTEK